VRATRPHDPAQEAEPGPPAHLDARLLERLEGRSVGSMPDGRPDDVSVADEGRMPDRPAREHADVRERRPQAVLELDRSGGQRADAPEQRKPASALTAAILLRHRPSLLAGVPETRYLCTHRRAIGWREYPTWGRVCPRDRTMR